ncbi:UDP-2,3-diacylglucosamine hydrolase [Fulvitalea axinellae]|uniref:UDP-2,3-diacylglucosamine hydrolase n=1 Tax=Fulvitalea axinellae TaxID=1182444 RepID=A0AAU9C7K1_9BACT|nr:UDP-2,3-diacylglucosamine hydrolase [Fulvitalea axinellae]
MLSLDIADIPEGKKIYFASDFHLGTPDYKSSRKREDKIVRWLDSVRHDAHAIFLLGDIFDFWFEYKTVIPKGFVRFQGKLAELSDAGIPIHIFIGNHDMWLFDYFPTEFGIPVHRENVSFTVNGTKFMTGHGDGLGPGDRKYKMLKRIFANKLCQWAFARLHPNLGIGIAGAWSKDSRASNAGHDEVFHGKDEWIYQFCQEEEIKEHHDFYIFGHRHLPMDIPVGKNARYINLGEWLKHCRYIAFDGKALKFEAFEPEGDFKIATLNETT